MALTTFEPSKLGQKPDSREGCIKAGIVPDYLFWAKGSPISLDTYGAYLRVRGSFGVTDIPIPTKVTRLSENTDINLMRQLVLNRVKTALDREVKN
jgi:hypothetical protein